MGRSSSSPRQAVRAGAVLVLLSAAAAVLAAVSPAAQGRGDCPEIIASLLPKKGIIRGGGYTAAGPMGMGSGAADLSFPHPCIETTKYPARLSIAVNYYGGEMAEMLKMQGDAVDEQTLQTAADEFGRGKRSPKREKLGEGVIVYVEYTTACPPDNPAVQRSPENPPRIPNVKLKGVARTTNVRLEVELEGQISLDLAKAAVGEVFENLKKARFDQIQ